VAAVGSVPARGRRHPIKVVVRAREHVRAGWSIAETTRLLEREFGVTVDPRSVRRWTSDRYRRALERAERERRRRRSMEAGARPMGPSHATEEFKLARMRKLRELGLSASDIAALMGHDFGDGLSAWQVRRALETGRYPFWC